MKPKAKPVRKRAQKAEAKAPAASVVSKRGGGQPGNKNAEKPFDDRDWHVIQQAVQAMCTDEQVAGMVCKSVETLHKRVKEKYGESFSDYKKNHQSGGLGKLRVAMFNSAIEDGNTTMQIWLSKQYLGMKDKIEIDDEDMKTYRIAFVQS